MFRRVLTLLCALVCVVVLSPTPAQAYTVGTTFNLPVSPEHTARASLVRKVIWAVENSPSGSTIRIAAYSFDRKDVADALLLAAKRGVNVQIILNDNWVSEQTRRMMNYLGRGPSNPSFVKVCDGACRGGTAGNLHTKVYSFTKAGSSEKLLLIGSANMTDRAVRLQWNDLVTLRDAPAFYDQFVQIFNQMKYDRQSDPRWVYYEDSTQPGLEAQYYRTRVGEPKVYTRTPTAEEDPVMNRLKAISCTAKPGTGVNGKTAIRIAMYAWYDDRGKWLAEQVVRLKKAGCDVRVLLSVAGGIVVKTLREGGVPIRNADWKYITEDDGTRTVDFYMHLKAMAVNGTYQGEAFRGVWTGSENWSDLSFTNDEITIGVRSVELQQAYFDKFAHISSKYTHEWGKYPLNAPPYRG